jgi:hypothetical protein
MLHLRGAGPRGAALRLRPAQGTWHIDFDTGTFNTSVSGTQDMKFDLGTWFCLHTNGSHLVRFRLDDKHPYPGGVDLTFRTWV